MLALVMIDKKTLYSSTQKGHSGWKYRKRSHFYIVVIPLIPNSPKIFKFKNPEIFYFWGHKRSWSKGPTELHFITHHQRYLPHVPHHKMASGDTIDSRTGRRKCKGTEFTVFFHVCIMSCVMSSSCNLCVFINLKA